MGDYNTCFMLYCDRPSYIGFTFEDNPNVEYHFCAAHSGQMQVFCEFAARGKVVLKKTLDSIGQE